MTQQPIISDQDKAQLKRTFRKDLTGEVSLRLFTLTPSPVTIPGRECPLCLQTQQLLEELSALSPKLHLETIDYYRETQLAQENGVTRIPAIVLDSANSTRVKFYGLPSGYELATIVDDIKSISRGVSPLSMGTRKKLRRINKPVHIQVFVTPVDVSCAGQARLAHALALDCPYISADVVQIQEFPALAKKYAVRSVPLTMIGEYNRLSGPATEGEMVEKVMEAGLSPS